MSLAILSSLLTNQYVLGIAGALGALLFAYFKGRSSANSANITSQIIAEAKQQSRLRAAEAKNLFLERKKNDAQNQVHLQPAVTSLIGMWNEFNNQKTTDSDASKRQP